MNARIPSLALAALVLLASAGAIAADLQAERTDVEQWKAQRLASITSDSGWLSLVGLFWLDPGENSFGRDPGNTLVLDNAHLAPTAGSFLLKGRAVRFVARPDAHITHDGHPVTSIDMMSDAGGEPTVLESGSLRLHIIERDGHVGIRARDTDNPKRRDFKGLEYFPLDASWAFDARFEPYEPHRHVRIVNILGMEEDMDSPGAVVFTRDGMQWRLDALLESPGDNELFIMFADATSAHETYGAGRFMYVPLPRDGTTRVDFNKAYNPPCAFSSFATCPLPPPENRLKLRVTAGEKKYGGHDDH